MNSTSKLYADILSDTFIFFPHPNLSIFKEVEDAHTRLNYLIKCPIYIYNSRFTQDSLNLEIKSKAGTATKASS